MNVTQSVKKTPQAAAPKAAQETTSASAAKPEHKKRRRPSQWEDIDTVVVTGPIKATFGKVIIHRDAPAAAAPAPRPPMEPSLMDRLTAIPPPAGIMVGDDLFFFGQPMSLEECRLWAERLTRWCLGA